MATNPTAPAVPDAITPITPAADTGAGTSGDKSLLDQLTGDDDAPGDLPPANSSIAPASNPLPSTPAATKAAPGSADFDTETASEKELDAHLRILEKKERIRKLTAGEQPATPAPAAIASASAPVPVTIVAAAAPATFTAPSATLIGKYDKATGLVQQLPQKLWDQLSAEDLARFTDVPTQPEKPASLI